MWQLRSGHEHNFIDGRTHVHHIHLYNSVTGGEHEIQLLLGNAICRECRRPFPQSDLSMLDPLAATQEAIIDLRGNHEAVMNYIRRHGIPVRLGPLAHVTPSDHRVVRAGEHALLVPPQHPHLLGDK